MQTEIQGKSKIAGDSVSSALHGFDFEPGKYYVGEILPRYSGNDTPREIRVVSVSRNGWVKFRFVRRDSFGGLLETLTDFSSCYAARVFRHRGNALMNVRTTYSVQCFYSQMVADEPMTAEEYKEHRGAIDKFAAEQKAKRNAENK